MDGTPFSSFIQNSRIGHGHGWTGHERAGHGWIVFEHHEYPLAKNDEEPLREFWMNEEKGLHLGRNGTPFLHSSKIHGLGTGGLGTGTGGLGTDWARAGWARSDCVRTSRVPTSIINKMKSMMVS